MTDVFIVDDRSPEDMAMLQALYSRSPASVVTHLEKLAKVGSGKFMDQYYVGYGHASIGDCGTTTLFIEQVSILLANAVQDNQLYNGQEASTRYLDFSQQAFLDPYRHPASTAIQDKWRALYMDLLPQLNEALAARYPYDPSLAKTEKLWANTLKARAFDIARGFLPVGTSTLLSWTTSLRQAREHVRRLAVHPLPEVRSVAHALFDKLRERYPNSFHEGDLSEADPRAAYARRFAFDDAFLSAEKILPRFSDADKAALLRGELVVNRKSLDLDGLREEGEVLAARPRGAALPRRLKSYGAYKLNFLLDFGSFHDIQRHRAGVCRYPLLDARFGLHPWYTGQVEDLLGAEAAARFKDEVVAQIDAVAALAAAGVPVKPELNQYLYPRALMGLVEVAYSLPQMVYVGEIRSAKTVHPSLRPVAQQMLTLLAQDLPGIALYGDMDEESLTGKRGEQTISEKTAG